MPGQVASAIELPTSAGPAALDACARIIQRYWPQASFQDAITGKNFRNYAELPIGRLRHLLVWRDDLGEVNGPDTFTSSRLHLIRSPDKITVILDGPSPSEMQPILDSIQGVLGIDILNTTAEAEFTIPIAA
jgi:hypothetical protein